MTTQHNEPAALIPAVDVVEDANGITLYADLPGVPKDKLVLEIEADTLTIAGDVALPVATQGAAPRFHRVFNLSAELDGEHASAAFDQGVLRLRIPKVEHAQPRKIEVAVS